MSNWLTWLQEDRQIIGLYAGYDACQCQGTLRQSETPCQMLTNIISNCESQADSFLGNTDVTVRFVPFCLIEASTDFDDKRYHPNVKDYCQCSFSFVGNLRFYSAFVCTRRLNKTTCYCQFTLHNNPLCVFHFVVPPPSSLLLAPIIFSNITSSQVN